MGPFLQFKLWASTAPSTERIFAAFMGLVLCALLAWSLVPEGTDEFDLAANDPGAVNTVPGAPGASSGPVATVDPSAPAEPGGETPAPGAPAPRVGSTGGSATSGGGATGASPTGGGGEAPQPGSPETTQAPAGGSAPLTASDTGVSPTAIKTGLVTLNLGGLEAAGFAAGLRGDIRQVIEALVNHVNAEGGINGRQIDPVIKTVDLVSEDDQRRKCLEFAQTDKVFAIVDSVGFLTEPTKSCVSVENKVPLYTAIPGSGREIAKAAPFQISPRKDHTRAVKDYVAAAVDDGFFSQANGFVRLGLVTDECELDTLAALKEELTKVGISNISEYRVACDITAQRSVGTPAVLQHQRDGVTHVFFGIANPAVDNYTDVADNANYRPKIFVSDWWTLSTDQSSAGFNPGVFNGARGVTSTVDGETILGRPFPELTQKCSKILEDAGLPPITGASEDIEVVIMCEHIELFVIMARNAGPNLTRRGMVEGIGNVGIFRGSTVWESAFTRPGKYTGGDLIKISEWKADCACWHAVTPYRQAYA